MTAPSRTADNANGRHSVGAMRAAIESRLRELAPADGADLLTGAMRYALLAPGKRVRPLLTLLAAAELGDDGDGVLDAACAIEMIHAASLVLDDLPSMDDAALRRGLPCTHAKFGEDVAILAAVALIGRAFSTVAACERVDPVARGTVTAVLARLLGPEGLTGGQLADLHGPPPGSALDRVLATNHLKTGVLFVASVDVAIAVAGAGPGPAQNLRRTALHLGQAFQLCDDLTDGAGADGEDGGKITALTVLGAEAARARMDGHVRDALEGLRPGGLLATFVRTLFAGGGRPAWAAAVPASA